MFQPETEDMLPRMAPKPSPDVISGTSEAIIRPQVPEVSILFGQQDTKYQQQIFMKPLQQQNKNVPPQTYAAWKKQMLPKITFPTQAKITNSQLYESNTGTTGYNCITTKINPIQLNTNPVLNVAPNVNVFGNRNEDSEPKPLAAYHRTLDSSNIKCYHPIQDFPASTTQMPLGTLHHQSRSRSKEILTICASTQTDSYIESTDNLHTKTELLSNLVTKKDVENICQVLDELRAEQQHILKLIETIAFNQYLQMTKETHCQDASVQTDFTDMDNPINLNDGIGFFQNLRSVPKNKFVEHLKPNNNIQQSPKGKPIAQSTAYRANSPQSKNLKCDLQALASPPVYQELKNPTEAIHKSASDTSIAMNELALKYLPNEKLAELLKELNMDCSTSTSEKSTTVNRCDFDKFGKGPSDISNASYKYLKKYRLLPEDHVESRKKSCQEGAMANNIENQTPLYNSPQYNVQIPPINQRQTPTNKCSPFATDRLPLSPLARAPAASHLPSQHIVDLDNIKQQPKLL